MPGDRILTVNDLEGSRGVSIPDYGEQERLRREELMLRRQAQRADQQLRQAALTAQQQAQARQAAGMDAQADLARMREFGVNRRFDLQNRRLTEEPDRMREFQAGQSDLARSDALQRARDRWVRDDYTHSRDRSDRLEDYGRAREDREKDLWERRGFDEYQQTRERGRQESKRSRQEAEIRRLEAKQDRTREESSLLDALKLLSVFEGRESAGRAAASRSSSGGAREYNERLNMERKNLLEVYRATGSPPEDAGVLRRKLAEIEARRSRGPGSAPGPVQGTGGAVSPGYRGPLENRALGDSSPRPRLDVGGSGGGGSDALAILREIVRRKAGLGGEDRSSDYWPADEGTSGEKYPAGPTFGPGEPFASSSKGGGSWVRNPDGVSYHFATPDGRLLTPAQVVEADRLVAAEARRVSSEEQASTEAEMRRRLDPNDRPPRQNLGGGGPVDGSMFGMQVRPGQLEAPVPSIEELLRSQADSGPPVDPPVDEFGDLRGRGLNRAADLLERNRANPPLPSASREGRLRRIREARAEGMHLQADLLQRIEDEEEQAERSDVFSPGGPPLRETREADRERLWRDTGGRARPEEPGFFDVFGKMGEDVLEAFRRFVSERGERGELTPEQEEAQLKRLQEMIEQSRESMGR